MTIKKTYKVNDYLVNDKSNDFNNPIELDTPFSISVTGSEVFEDEDTENGVETFSSTHSNTASSTIKPEVNIDTIRFYVELVDFIGVNQNIENCTYGFSQGTMCNGKTYSGDYKGIKYHTRNGMVIFTGSLAKAIHGNNIQGTTLKEISDFFYCMSKVFNVDFFKYAKLFRVDLGINVFTNHKPFQYISRLGALSRFQHHVYNSHHSISYTQDRKALAVYDKVLQNKKGWYVPPQFQGLNILRIEFRALKKVKDVLKTSSNDLSILVDGHIRKILENETIDLYQSVGKINVSMPSLNFSGVRQFKDSLVSWFFSNSSFYHYVVQNIKSSVASGNILPYIGNRIIKSIHNSIAKNTQSSLNSMALHQEVSSALNYIKGLAQQASVKPQRLHKPRTTAKLPLPVSKTTGSKPKLFSLMTTMSFVGTQSKNND